MQTLIREKILLCSHNRDFLKDFASLLDRHFEVQRATSSEMVAFLAREWMPSLFVIDSTSPILDALKGMRQHLLSIHTGALVIAPKPDSQREQLAFISGVDHFVVLEQDFSPVLWRMLSLAKRMRYQQWSTSPGDQISSSEPPENEILLGSVKIFPREYLVKREDQRIPLSPVQFRLLLALVSHPDQLLTRHWLKEAVWENAKISLRSIDAQISKLKKIVPELEPVLNNIYGKGYLLTGTHHKKAA